MVIADLALRPEAQQLVDEHSTKDGSKPRAVFIKTNVVRFDDLAAMFDLADREFGGADLVCLLARMGGFGGFKQQTDWGIVLGLSWRWSI